MNIQEIIKVLCSVNKLIILPVLPYIALRYGTQQPKQKTYKRNDIT